MKKVFVTGITGLLGNNTVIKLIENGYFVIALVRKKGICFFKENENLTLVEGDLFSDLSKHLKDVDYVIHIAAETRQNLLLYRDYQRINCDATIHLFCESVKANVQKFLFISSANTLGFGSLEELGNEKNDQKYPFTHSFYAKSKSEAENFLLQQKKNTEVIILNPSFMIGNHDYKPSSGKIILWVWKKNMVFYPKGGKNFVHVEDAATGIVCALKKGKKGEKYLLANENLTYRDFFTKVNTVTDQQPIMIPIPDFILQFLGFLGDLLRFCRIKTNLSSVNMKALLINNYYSNQKSIDELGIKYQPIEKAIEDAVHFFKNR